MLPVLITAFDHRHQPRHHAKLHEQLMNCLGHPLIDTSQWYRNAPPFFDHTACLFKLGNRYCMQATGVGADTILPPAARGILLGLQQLVSCCRDNTHTMLCALLVVYMCSSVHLSLLWQRCLLRGKIHIVGIGLHHAVALLNSSNGRCVVLYWSIPACLSSRSKTLICGLLCASSKQ